MDIFLEKIVSRKQTAKDMFIKLGVIVLAFILIMIILGIDAIKTFSPLFTVGVIYGAYILLTSRNIEYEYIVTNGDIDIDMIIAKRRRKRVFSTNCKNFEILAKVNSTHYDNYKNIAKKYNFAGSMESEDVYFAVLNYEKERAIFIFEPNEKMLDSFKVYIPRKLFID